MSTKNLEAFVNAENRLRKIFKQTPLSLLNPKDRQRIADNIDGQLSPENLHCDGEISPAQARKKYRYLTQCAAELQSIDPSVKFYEFNY